MVTYFRMVRASIGFASVFNFMNVGVSYICWLIRTEWVLTFTLWFLTLEL